MRQLSFRHIAMLLLGFVLLLFASCNRNKDAASKKIKENKPSAEAVTVTHKDPIQIPVQAFDTACYYFGMVEDNCYYFKINKTDEKSISGHYYPVGKSAWLEAVPFSIVYENQEYHFRANGTDKEIRFQLVLDTASISGQVTTSFSNIDMQSFFFEPYAEPPFTEYSSKRFKEDLFQYEVLNNVVYGQGKGYWASYPMNDSKYLKMLTRTIIKTASYKNLDLDMDIYMPEGDTLALHPLIVFIHGGSFYFGDKGAQTMSQWCGHFAKAGYVTASINYRLGFQFTKASIQKCGYMAIQDAHAAIRFLVANADKYGIDTSAIFVAGTSAGAITALNVAYLTNSTCPPFVKKHHLDSKLGTIDRADNNLTNTFRIKAVANMWGALYDLSVLKDRRIPIISFHGTADEIVPYDEGFPFSSLKSDIGEVLFDKMYGSKAIHKRMDDLHIHNAFYPIEGGRHSPYTDADGSLNSTYYFIQNKIQSFFLQELSGNTTISYDKQNPSEFSIDNPDVKSLSWKVEGGFITDRHDQTISVLWRNDKSQHSVTASGILNNGATFNKKLQIKHS